MILAPHPSSAGPPRWQWPPTSSATVSPQHVPSGAVPLGRCNLRRAMLTRFLFGYCLGTTDKLCRCRCTCYAVVVAVVVAVAAAVVAAVFVAVVVVVPIKQSELLRQPERDSRFSHDTFHGLVDEPWGH